MSAIGAIQRRLRRRSLALGVLACASLALGLPGAASVAPASGAGSVSEAHDYFYTDAAVPANNVMMLGASPGEAPGETWGIGQAGQGTASYVIVRYATGAGWTRAPAIRDAAGQPLEGFTPAQGVLAGQMTTNGSGALLGEVSKADVLLIRDPGKETFQETSAEPLPEESGEAVLHEGEELFASHAPLVAAVEEGGQAGAFVVPGDGARAKTPEAAVLHWEGQAESWTREPIELPAGDAANEFEPLAIAAVSPSDAWLLARVSSSSEAVSLFRRQPGAKGSAAKWEPVSPGEGASKPPAGTALSVGGAPVLDETESSGQLLTVTEKGVWVDGKPGPDKSVTLFFEPSATEADSGEVKASWCNVEGCTHPLPEPEELPLGSYRSFAWSSSSAPFGERVITGYSDGVVLRLEGEQFLREATIGGPAAPDDVGASKGAAFSSAYEGWLGNAELAVHASREQALDRLEYWPAPFHEPLLAIAPKPGAEIGGTTSEALAVGEAGEVARFIPEQGWQPESLFEASGRRGEPQLRAVAWPTQKRAYAVGARGEQFGVVGEMWLWREETHLWEPDPAAPVNLRAGLLGIAFAPGEPSRGYVVGQGGTLMRYGKTWTQEATCAPEVAQPCIPAEVAGASFTAVAFAGAEALVAYRIPHVTESSISYSGGVLANSGAGWHIDSEVADALPAGYVPWTVAGLPDGGAALSAAVPGGNQEPLVLERDTASSAWAPTPQPYPGYAAPASLALFREGGALRVVGSGAIPDTIESDYQTPPPAGSPPNLTEPYPLGLGTGVLRQTASGWSDEEHERRILRPPPGGYKHWDLPYNPDPTAAILLNESGSAGWAVGGLQTSRPDSDTADIARYPGDGTKRLGVGNSEIPLKEPGEVETPHTTFAVGGGAQCAAPCATLANAKIGPDVWLQKAIERSRNVAGTFLYTGPRVTTGETSHATLATPDELELERFANLLVQSGGLGTPPVRVAASSYEQQQGSDCEFDDYLGRFTSGLDEAGCASAQTAYYAFSSVGAAGAPPVRVIVLEDGGGVVQASQLDWLDEQLAQARGEGSAALVMGNANLGEDAEKHAGNAQEVIEAIVQGEAVAYLYDAPERNVQGEFRLGTKTVRTYGSGTLGYVNALGAEQSDFVGASGFLLVEVEGRTQVKARLIPDIEELSLDAHKGVLLHRSEAALFSALARRPRAGGVGSGQSSENESASFVPIPANCQGVVCKSEALLPEYRFSSEKEETGEFVKPNLALGPEEVELEDEKPVRDSQSGLFCAFNPGETKVTIEAGGLSAYLTVKVEPGSVRRPCGTTPVAKAPLKTQQQSVAVPVQPPASAAPAGAAPAPTVPLPPLPAPAPAPATVVPPAKPPVQPPPFLFAPAPAVLPAVILPPPLPPVGEPTPPSGTSAVTSPVEAAQREEEDEQATESVSAQAVAYRQSEQEPAAAYLLGLIVLAAFAGVTIPRARRGRRDVRVAPATLSTLRSQRRMSRNGRHRW